MKQLQAVYADSANSYDFLAKKGEILAKVQGELEKKTDDYRNLLTLTKMSLLEHRSATEELAEAAEKATSAYKEAKKETDTYKKALDAADDALASYKKQLIDSGESLKKHKDEITALKKAQLDAKEAYKISKESTAELKKEMDSANASYARNASNIKYCEEHQELYSRQIIESETELINLNREIDKNNTYLQEAATSADGTAHSIDKYGKEVKDAAEDTKSFANAADLLAQAIVASGAIEGAEKLRDAIVDTAKASIGYESAFAGVRKTVDGTAEELEALSGGLRNMSLEIPIAATELAGIAEAAGQLGIAKENILGFTEIVANLSTTTDLSAEEAAISLARIANITGLMAAEYDNFGSTLVALGNNSAAFESEILEMANRLAGMGSIVEASNAQLLGIATTLVSVGIEAESGGTAFSKLLGNIELAVETGSEKVQQYAKVAGMSVQEFSDAWREDAVGAVTAFIEGLGDLDSQGQSAIVILDEMGITEQRLRNAILKLSEAEGLLSKNLELANSAWVENTALTDEAAVRFETTESKIILLQNAVNNLKITMGDQLTAAIGEPLEALTDFVGGLDDFVQKYPGITSAITALAAGFGTLAVIGTVLPLVASLGSALVALPHGAAIAGIGALAVAVGTFAATLPKATDEVDNLAKEIDAIGKQIDKTRESILDLKSANEEETASLKTEQEEISKAIQTVEELGKKTDITASESEILKTAMDKLNRLIPGLKLSYDNLNDSLEDTVYHLRLVASAQALVDEAVSKTELRESLEGMTSALESDVSNAKKTRDDAQALFDEKKELERQFFESRKNQKQTEEALKPGESPWSPYSEDLKTLTEELADAEVKYSNAVGARDANKRKITELNSEIANLDKKYAETAEEIKKANSKLFGDIGNTTDEAANAFDEFITAVENSGKKSASALADYGEAFKAGFSVPFLTAINETASNSDEVLGAMMTRYRELVTTYGEGSEEVKAFVTGVNTTFAESAGAEDALVEGLKEYGIVVEETGKKAVTSTKATKEAIDEAGQTIIAHADTVKKNLEALSKEYDSAYKSARSSLDGIGGLFGEVAFKTDKSISDMLSGLDSQANYFTGYMLNLQRAAQIGIDEGLVAALADGSDESAGYLQKIIDEFNKVAVKYGENSEEAEAFVTDFNTKFEATSKAKDALAATMAGIQTNFEERAGDILAQADDLITELSGYSGNAYDEVSKAVSETLTDIADGFTKFQVAAQEKSQGIIDAALYIKQGINTTLEVLPEEMKVAGQNVSLGLSEGILDKAGVLEDTVRRLAKEAIIGAAKDELGIHSPSEEGREIGEFYDEGIAQGIERNESTVISANLKMISDLESASQSAAAAAGTALGNTMAKSMAAALQAGQALRQQVESGKLIVDGKVVQTAASVGIPSLTGQAAIDFNNEMKEFHNLPSDWSNQDIVDWLNGGGFHGSTGGSSSLGSAIEQAVKNESANANVLVSVSHLGNKGADGKTWGYGSSQHYNPNLSDQNIGASRIVINQTFNGKTSYYDAKQGSKAGVQEATYY